MRAAKFSEPVLMPYPGQKFWLGKNLMQIKSIKITSGMSFVIRAQWLPPNRTNRALGSIRKYYSLKSEGRCVRCGTPYDGPGVCCQFCMDQQHTSLLRRRARIKALRRLNS